jgi:hypothetical protein
MFFSCAVHARSKARLSILSFLIVLSSIAGASVVSFHRPTVSAAGSTSDGSRAGKSDRSSPQGKRKTQLDNYGGLPLVLEPNFGQAPTTTKFLSRGAGYQLSLTANDLILTLPQRQQSQTAAAGAPEAPRRDEGLLGGPIPAKADLSAVTIELGMKFVGANPAPQIEAERELPGKSNYLIGNDPTQWRTNIPTYGSARYREIYPGIDLLFYGNQRQLEYDFVVRPGAQTEQIRLAFRGANKLEIEKSGDLVLRLPGGGELRQLAPVLYQEVDGTRRSVTGSYVLYGENQVGFRVGAYDPKLPLVIDPVLAYSSYLNFYGTAWYGGVAVDGANDVYMVGSTLNDVYVAKVNAAGTAFIYTTAIGGSDNNHGDQGRSIAVDSSGNALVSGHAWSFDFPMLNAFQPAKASTAGNIPDAFVFKLNSTGSTLIFSTYLGGRRTERNDGIAVDASGNTYVTGLTDSRQSDGPFPTVNAYQPARAGGNDSSTDAFVTKFTPTGEVVFSTYLGGAGQDGGTGIAADEEGSAYVVGGTTSDDFPTQNAFQPAQHGDGDLFITKFNPEGTTLSYSTYLGGVGQDSGLGVAVDASRNAYVLGYAYSTDYPTQNALDPTQNGAADIVVTKLNAAGSALIYSTYVGGTNDDRPAHIALDTTGDAYVSGYTFSTNFPVVNPIQMTNANADDAVFFKLNAAGSAFVYSTYFGGNFGDYGHGVAVDSDGNGIYMGRTNSTNFPTLNPISSPTVNGESAFLVKIVESGPVSISGRVLSLSGAAVPNAAVELDFPGNPQPLTSTTDASGNYAFTNLDRGISYTLSAAKVGDVNGITGFDASLAARFAANLIPLSATEQLAADASGNGGVTAFDASLIARTALGIPNSGIAGTWKFSPSTLTLNGLNADQTSQNLTAILVGDVSGNWTPSPSASMRSAKARTAITVSLPGKQDPPGGSSTIPINVGDTTSKRLGAYTLDISFDPEVLQPQATAFDTGGTLSNGWSITCNTSTPGHIRLTAFNTGEMKGKGILLNLQFNVVGKAGSRSALTWASFEFNEGDVGANHINGSFTATGPSARITRSP